MKKNDDVGLFYWKSRIRKMLLLMKLICFWILIGLMQIHATTYGQSEMVSFEKRQMTIDQVFNVIILQLRYDIFYSDDEVDVTQVVEIPALELSVEEVLRSILSERLKYQFIGKTIVIAPQGEMPQVKESLRLKGWVHDENKEAIPGVTVRVVGVPLGTSTNEKGWFAIDLPMQSGSLEFSFVGYKTVRVDFTAKTDTLRIVMEEDLQEVEEVVVNGYFTQKKNSYTGSVTTVKGEELIMASPTNILKALAFYGPRFAYRGE